MYKVEPQIAVYGKFDAPNSKVSYSALEVGGLGRRRAMCVCGGARAGTCRWAARAGPSPNGENDNFLPFGVQCGETE